MENKKNQISTDFSEVENSKQEIEKFKHKLLVISILMIISFVVFIAIIFIYYKNNFKPEDKLKDSAEIATEIVEKIETEENDEKIKKFSDFDELRDFLESKVSDNFYGLDKISYEGDSEVVETRALSTSGVALSEDAIGYSMESDSVQSDYSKTNVQVEGVDEADIIKTDGDYIYAVSKKNLFIVDSHDPENLSIVRIISFENQPTNIYLNKDRLIVFGRDSSINKKDIYSFVPRYSQYTFFKIFDISDRKNPKQLKDYDFEGRYVNSRMIGDYVYFLTNTNNSTYIDKMPVPRILEGEKDVYSFSDRKCLGTCPDVYYVDDFTDRYTMVSVMAINVQDIDGESNFNHDVYLMPYNQNLYVSENNLYLTYTKHFNQNEFLTNLKLEIIQNKLTDWEKNKISKIKSTENFILTNQEKINKIREIIDRKSFSKEEKEEIDRMIREKIKELYPQISAKMEQTMIHKISIDKNELKYQGFGSVSGTVLNQFSMDESIDGHFRIATTRNPSNWYFYRNYILDESDELLSDEVRIDTEKSYNNLYILDKDLQVSGSVERLAEGEKIYSARFMGDRAYMVTFRQTDPLFVIDVKNPKEPKVLGQLKIPGFSNYLHPYDKDHLIGIGKDTKENEFGGVQTKGVKVAMFDVSDVENPKEVAKYVFPDGSNSIALNEHKAVLFDKEKNLLVLPLTNYYAANKFIGAAVFKITDKTVELRGKVSHLDLMSNDSECYKNDFYGCDFSIYDRNTNILRSLWIDDVLYTFSNSFIQANDLLDSLKLIKSLELRKKESKEDFELFE